jgi:hypothetical protein
MPEEGAERGIREAFTKGLVERYSGINPIFRQLPY